MGRYRFGLAVVLIAACAFGARAVEVEIQGDITSATNYTINVEADNTDTYTGTITLTDGAKLIKIGLGMLALAGENDLPGGIDIRQGAVRADAAGSLGDGPITIAQGTTDHGQLFYNAEGATFLNPTISVTGTFNDGVDYAAVQALKSATVKADITSVNGVHLGNYPVNGTSKPELNTQYTVFDGTVTAGGNLRLRTYGTLVFNKKMSCTSYLTTSTVASNKGKLYLNGQDNSFPYISAYNCGPIAGATNAFGGGYITHSYGTSSSWNTFDLNGFDQTLTYFIFKNFNNPSYNPTSSSTGARFISTGKPATLTLTGTSSAATKYGVFSMDANVRLVCDFGHKGFTQVISNRTHKTAEPLYVKKGVLDLRGTTSFPNLKALRIGAEGVLKLDSSVADAFKSLTNLTVESGGKLIVSETTPTPLPFANTLELDLYGDAEVTLPPGTDISCRMVKVDGEPVAFGQHVTPCDELPQIKTESIRIYAQQRSDSGPVVATWTGASAPDNWMTTMGNWTVDGEVPASLDLGGFMVDAAIEGGSEMVPDGLTRLCSLKVSKPYDQTPFTIGAAGQEMYVAGKMTVTNCAQVTLRGTISTPGHVDQGTAASNGDKTLWIRMHEYPGSSLPDPLPEWAVKGGSDRTLPVILDGVTIEKPVYYYPGSNAGSELFYVNPNTTNVIKGAFAYSKSWSYIDICAGAVLEFAGGVDGGTRMQMSKSATGTLRISGKPATFGSGLTLQRGILELDVEGNMFGESGTAVGGLYANSSTSGNTADIRFLRSGCFTADGLQQMNVSGSTRKRVEFNMTTQKVSRLYAVATGSGSYLHGDYPAMVEICGGCRGGLKDSKAFVTLKTSMPVTGGLGFHYVGNGIGRFEGIPDGTNDTYQLTGRAFASCGDLEVSGGTLELAANATWLNGTNLTARGTGKLKANAGATFGRHAVLRFFDGGTFELPAGERQKVAECWVNGVKVDPGEYDAAKLGPGDRLYGHLTGGILRVGKLGVVLIVR